MKRLSTEDAVDYVKLKDTLLKYFERTYALKKWKVTIFKIVDQRIQFYSQNTNLNPLSDI